MVEQLSFQIKDGGSIPTSPLQFKVKRINVHTATLLNKRWHSRLPLLQESNITRNTYYVCYGAYFDNKCFAVAIWSSPIAQNRFRDGRTILELRRFAICSEAPKNTASRLLSVMVNLIKHEFPMIHRLISYQDTAVHLGTIYKASSWQASHTTKFIPWKGVNPKATQEDMAIGDKIRWELLLHTEKPCEIAAKRCSQEVMELKI